MDYDSSHELKVRALSAKEVGVLCLCFN